MRWVCRRCGPFETLSDGAAGLDEAANHPRLLHPDVGDVDRDEDGRPVLIDATGVCLVPGSCDA